MKPVMFSAVFTVVIVIIADFLSIGQCATLCSTPCRFTFCSSARTISLSTPADTPLEGPVCLAKVPVGVLNTGPAFVRFGGTYIPLSDFSPPGLMQTFAPSFFKAYGAGVGHQAIQKGQQGFLNNKCIVLPVLTYQNLSGGIVSSNIQLSRPLRDCISFGIVDETMPPKTTPPPTGVPSPLLSASPSASASILDGTPSNVPSAVPSHPISTSLVSPSPSPSAVSSSLDASPSSVPSAIPSVPVTATSQASKSPIPPVSPPGTVAPDEDVDLPPLSPDEDEVSFTVEVVIRNSSGSTKEDLYLLSDATGSMGDAIDDVRNNFQKLVDARSAASDDVAFGVGFYRDEDDTPFENLQKITSDVDKVKTGIEKLVAAGGGDVEEANLYALYVVATSDSIGWRQNSRRILVYFGDSPGHEPTCVDGLRLTRASVVKALNKESITVVGTDFGALDGATNSYGCSGSSDTEDGQASAITSGTGGALVMAEDQADLIEKIVGGVEKLEQELAADVSDCESKGVKVEFEPALPVMVKSGSKIEIKETVSLSKKVCSTVGPIQCKVKFTLSSAETGTQTINTSVDVDGC